MRNWFRNLKIGKKLAVGFSILLGMMVLIGATGYVSIRTIARNLDRIFQVQLPSIDYILETDRDLFQALVAERSLLSANLTDDHIAGFKAFYEENLQQSADRWNAYKALAATAEEKALFPQYEQAREAWIVLSRQAVYGNQMGNAEDAQSIANISFGPAKEKFDVMRTYLDQLTEINLKLSAAAHRRAQITYTMTIIVFIAMVAVGMGIGAVLAVGITFGITTPLSKAVTVANQLSEGDLTQQITASTTEETGQLLTSMSHMLTTLKRVVTEITQTSGQIVTGSQQVSTSATEMSQGANTQAASTEQLSASMQQMAANIRQNADNALQTEKIANKAAEDAQKARKAMKKAIRAMQSIAKEISVVTQIAQQTRMLSLNATIEAGKAQEYGKGFAVVASEVRQLATQTQNAAQNITELVTSGVLMVTKTGEVLTNLIPDIQRTAELVQEISAATREQDSGVMQINTAIQLLDHATQQHSAVSQELAATAEQFAAQAHHFQETMAFFKTDNTPNQTIQAKTPILHEAQKWAEDTGPESTGQDIVSTPHTGKILDLRQPEVPGGDDLDAEFERF